MLQITVVTGPSKPKLEGERLGGTIDFIEWLLCIISKANESIWEHCAAILMSRDAANLRSTCSFVQENVDVRLRSTQGFWKHSSDRESGLWRLFGQLRRKPLLPYGLTVMTFNLAFPSSKARQWLSVYHITTFDHISPSDGFSRLTLVTDFGAINKHWS